MRDILVDENIFRLTKDVVNPLFDKRNKHGVESIKELKAGHTIYPAISYSPLEKTLTLLSVRTKKINKDAVA